MVPASMIDMATDPTDALSAASDNHCLLLENDRVRILDTNVAPGIRNVWSTRMNGPRPVMF